jgi:hypothetical protein
VILDVLTNKFAMCVLLSHSQWATFPRFATRRWAETSRPACW